MGIFIIKNHSFILRSLFLLHTVPGQALHLAPRYLLCACWAGREGAMVFSRAEYMFLGVLDHERI